MVRSRSSSRAAQVRSSARSWSISTNWLLPPPRPPPRRSCDEYRNVCTPPTLASSGRSRAITASDDTPPRSRNGFRPTSIEPRFSCGMKPAVPLTTELTVATAGSRSITATTARWRSTIAA